MPVVAVGALAALVIALLLLLLIYAAQALGRLLSGVFPNIHIPGIGNIRAIVSGAVQSVISGVASSLHAAADLVDGFIIAPVTVLGHWFQEISLAVRDIADALDTLYRHVILPGLAAGLRYTTGVLHTLTHAITQSLTVALDYAQAAALAAVNEARTMIGAAVRALTASLAVLADHVTALVANAVTALDQRLSTLAARLGGDLAAVETFAADGIAAAETYAAGLAGQSVIIAESLTQQAIRTAETYASAAVQAGILAVDVDVTGVLAKAWVQIDDTVAALEGVIATDLPDLGALVKAIPGEAVGVAGALAGTVAISEAMLKYLEKCGVPNCKNLGGFGYALQDLLGLVGDASLVAFIVEAIHDPHTVARDTLAVAGPVVSGTVHTVRDLSGV